MRTPVMGLRQPDRRPLFAASAQSTQPIGNRLGGETEPGTFGPFVATKGQSVASRVLGDCEKLSASRRAKECVSQS